MTSTNHWKAAGASAIGRGHETSGGRCEDAWAFARRGDVGRGQVLAVCVCDGAGSASNGWRGAQLVSRFFSEWTAENFSYLAAMKADAGIQAATALRRLIRRRARACKSDERTFACTLVALATSDNGEWIAFHVGDGAVLGRLDGHWTALSMPSKGEFANATYFVTDEDVTSTIQTRSGESPGCKGIPTAFALFSDGVEVSLINRRTGAIAPAVESVYGWLTKHSEPEVSMALEGQLRDVLCQRTGDDCSLAVIAR